MGLNVLPTIRNGLGKLLEGLVRVREYSRRGQFLENSRVQTGHNGVSSRRPDSPSWHPVVQQNSAPQSSRMVPRCIVPPLITRLGGPGHASQTLNSQEFTAPQPSTGTTVIKRRVTNRPNTRVVYTGPWRTCVARHSCQGGWAKWALTCALRKYDPRIDGIVS